MPEEQVPLHPWPAQVQIAVAQAHGLVHGTIIVDIERRRDGRVQDGHLARQDLNLARRDVGVGQPLGALPHHARDLHNVLTAHLLRHRVGIGRDVWVSHNLHEPRPVAQVEEDEPTVIPPAVDPPGECHFLAHVIGPQSTAAVRFQHRPLLCIRVCPVRRKKTSRPT